MSALMRRIDIKTCPDGTEVVLFVKPSPHTGEAYCLTLLRGMVVKVECTYVHISCLTDLTETLKALGETL
jgi:hypothetical protein